jgi:hypothetical protein
VVVVVGKVRAKERGDLGLPRKTEWWGSVLVNDVREGPYFGGRDPVEWGWVKW